MTLREELCSLAEPAYGDFQAKLMPGVPRQRILGVRLPQLRRIAARIARSGGSLPEAGQGAFVEEVMLEGMVLGRLKDRPTEELLALTAAFVPKIDSWAVCDTFCAGLIWVPRRREEVWAFLQPYFDSGEEYPARFAAVMAMSPSWPSMTVSIRLTPRLMTFCIAMGSVMARTPLRKPFLR